MTATLDPRPAPVPVDVRAPGFDTRANTDTGAHAGPPDGFDDAAFAAELDALRAEVVASLGASDAAYIRRVITGQRRLELAGRAALAVGVLPPAWLAGVALLSTAKILENMEIGHNVMHGQWDWMRDPEIHSTTWEWDTACPSRQWKHTHNHLHHQWTNVAGRDHDIGYHLVRIDDAEPWRPHHLLQPFAFVALATLFEYGVSLHDVNSSIAGPQRGSWRVAAPKLRESVAKMRSQAAKDYVWYPLLSAPLGVPGVLASASGAAAANVVRNWWSCAVIFCGHFPRGVEIFPPEAVEGESRGQWYRRQVLGSANFSGGRLTHLLAGNLDHQIEHHLFPDLPSNRYASIAPRVREICERHDLPYRTGSFARQFSSVVTRILRNALPDRLPRLPRPPWSGRRVAPVGSGG